MMSLCMGFEQGIKVAVVSERDRRNRNGLLEKLPPEQFDFEAVFRRICGSERTRHRSVKLVHDISGDPTHVDSAFLASLGFRDLRLIEWDWSNEDDAAYGATQKMSKGGFVKAAQMEKERNLSTFVFLRCEGVEPGEHEAIARYSTLIGILMHEMGHVDDIEKRKVPEGRRACRYRQRRRVCPPVRLKKDDEGKPAIPNGAIDGKHFEGREWQPVGSKRSSQASCRIRRVQELP